MKRNSEPPLPTPADPDAARKREAALREVLDLISRSRDDEGPVFEAIVRRAALLCGASAAALVLGRAGDTVQRLAAQSGMAPESIALYARGEVSMNPDISLAAQAILTGKTILIPDMIDTDGYRNGVGHFLSAVHDTGIRTQLFVPLIAQGGGLGSFLIYRKDVRPFTADDIALVETFAAQAVIAIENVRQFRELQTRLAREKASAEVLAVISHSRDDDRPVFDAILQNATRLCGADSAALLLGTPAGPHLTLAALWQWDSISREAMDRFIADINRVPMKMDPALHISARAICTAGVVHIDDLAQTEGYLSGEASFRFMVEDQGVRTTLSVPIFDVTGPIGCISVHRNTVRPYSDDEIALIESFAAQAVIAIENVRQFREVQERLAREAAMREILEVISQSRDDDTPVFDLIARSAARLCGAAVCTVWRVEDGMAHYCASHGFDEADFKDILLTPKDVPAPLGDNSLLGIASKTRAVARIEDGTAESYVNHEWARAHGLRQLIGVPIFVGNDVWGSINLMWKEGRVPRDTDIQLVENFAAQASIAIENVRQFRAIQMANAELQARLEREAATREILQVISQSRDDDQPVFEAILRNAALLCEATTGGLVIGRSSDTHWRTVAMFGTDALPGKLPDFGLVPMDPAQSITARAIVSGETIHTRDILETPEYRNGAYAARIVGDEIGARVLLNVPLMRKDGALGAIELQRLVPVPFTQPQIELVQSFAAQAVIAIENVRQFRELQTRLAREAATREILEVISRNPDDDRPVFDVILRNAISLCAGDTSALLMGRKDDPRMTMAAWRDRESGSSVMDDGMIAQMNATDMLMDPTVHVSAQAITEARNIHVLDVKQHPSYLAGEPSWRIMGDALGVRSALVVPLIDARGALGTVHVHRREVRPFTDDEIALVETFAAQAVIAIENVRQFKALEALNAELGDRVQDQVGEIERMGRLKRFLPAAVADAVVSSGSEKMLSSHRALLGVLFCDIRGFTAFCETAEPEETIEVLQTYHEEMGRLINTHGAGVDHRMGDGIMVLFNDPLPCDDPAGDAVRLAIAMRERMAELCQKWKRMGHRLGFGIGVSLGYATVGMVGSGGRHDYTASGTAINLAARLCDDAQDGEILISPRARLAVEGAFTAESRGEIAFKGIRDPVEVFCVTGVVG